MQIVAFNWELQVNAFDAAGFFAILETLAFRDSNLQRPARS